MPADSFLTYTNPTLPKILVFDSGVGGLTITRELVDLLPNTNITYAADNAAFPYGTKNKTELLNRIERVLRQLHTLTDADIIVIACNSASTIALPHLRSIFSTPIVGVVPAIKPAAMLTQSKVIGLLATPGTVSRQYTDGLIEDFARNHSVIRLGSNKLVELAEDKLSGKPIDITALNAELLPLQQGVIQGLDTVVLACTHFPLLKPELSLCLPQVKYWVDSGLAIAKRVADLLSKHYHWQSSSTPGKVTYQSVFTGEHQNLDHLQQYLKPWFSTHCTLVKINS